MTDPRKPGWPLIVAVCAPFGRDEETLADLLKAWGASARACTDAAQVGAAARDATVSLMLFTEEALEAHACALVAGLREQPAWSDLPLIVLSAEVGRGGSGDQWRFLQQFANMTVLGRPTPSNVLRAAFDTACRTRAWQYTVRDQMHTLSAAAALLEQRVLERTAELYAEVETRKRIEGALNEARKLEAIGRLTGGVAHDFNNLLQVIQVSTSVLPLVAPGSERFHGALQAIQRAASRGAKLTQQLLAFGRRQALATGDLDVERQLGEMRELLQQSLREQIRLSLEVETGLWHADADATQLEVALLNLTVNAKDAMPQGGTVRIFARNLVLPSPHVREANGLQGEFIWLRVSDSGPGMPPEVARQAFDPFFTTKPVGSGTGLGLSQVYGFASQSQGMAWIDTSPAGTSVSILLPRSRQLAVAPVEAPVTDAPMAPLSGVRVLCVEDDPEVAQVSVALLGLLGCRTTLVDSAAAALRHSLDEFDVVFSDVAMPGEMDGIDLARAIRTSRPAMPVLLASGYAVAPERLDGLNIPLLAKPYSQDALHKSLVRVLGLSDPCAGRTSM